MNNTIAVIEDDLHLLEFLQQLLVDQGYVVHTASDGVKALKLIEKVQPDLVLLDLELPTIKGDTVCIETKKNYPQIPIIILTARDATSQIVQGLNLGADDYMTKPFEAEELVARVRARLRTNNGQEKILTASDLMLNPQTMEVRRADKKIDLTPQEFRLLEYLLSNKGRVLTREMILGRLWRTNPDIETRVVDVYVGYLRKKIDSGSEVKLIQSVRGFGYKIDDIHS